MPKGNLDYFENEDSYKANKPSMAEELILDGFLAISPKPFAIES